MSLGQYFALASLPLSRLPPFFVGASFEIEALFAFGGAKAAIASAMSAAAAGPVFKPGDVTVGLECVSASSISIVITLLASGFPFVSTFWPPSSI